MTSPLSPIDANSQEPHNHVKALGSHDKHSVSLPAHQSQFTAMEITPTLSVNIPQESFLYCPIQTFTQSLEVKNRDWITKHDLVESYSTLCIRFRTLTDWHEDSNTLSLLKRSIPTLVQCLQRDIREGLSFFSRPPNVMSTSDMSLAPTLDEHEIQLSVDSSMLCLSALTFTALIFSLPAFFSLVSESDQTDLLDPIIEICGEHHLPIFNANKIYAQAFLCLRTPAAPKWVPLTHLRGMTGVLEAILESRDDENFVKEHGLKTIHHFLIHAPSQFIQPFSGVLPSLLVNLTASSVSCRIESTHALCAFVTAKWGILDTMPDLILSISNTVLDFLDHHGAPSGSGREDYMLPGLLQDALQGDDSAWGGQGPVWALVTLASLIILCDAPLFSRRRSLRLNLEALRYSSRHKMPTVVALHAEVWKCAIWALSRSFLLLNEPNTTAVQETHGRAFRVLVQDLKLGIGTCLVSTLMQNSSNNISKEFTASAVREAVDVVKKLLGHRSPRYLQEGFSLLHRLVDCISSSESTVAGPVPLDYVPAGLVDGSWLRMTKPELAKALKLIPPFAPSHIRSLTEAEINNHWQDLSELWALAVERLQSDMTPELSHQLTEIWQALLLCQAHLTQGQLHLTASTPFATKLATLITRFLTPTAEPDVRKTQLCLAWKWWRVIKNVFQPTWLSIPAEIILSGIMDRQIDLTVESLKESWSDLCSDLVNAGAPTLLHILHNRVTAPFGHEQDLIMTRQLWLILGRHNVGDGVEQSWTNLAAFLALPFHCSNWELSEDESDLWKSAFCAALSTSQKDGIEDRELVNHFIGQIGERRDHAYLALLESGVKFGRYSLCRALLPPLNQFLERIYATVEKVTALKILQAIGQLLNIEDSSEIASSMKMVQTGVAVWLEDRQGYIEEKEHSEMVKAVYLPALESLGRMNPKPNDLLPTLELFLGSVFTKVTPSATGPIGLMGFWLNHYHQHPTLAKTCPMALYANLKAFSDFCGGILADDISLDTLSPSTIISDSQSPLNPKVRALQQEYSRFVEFEEVVGFGFQFGTQAREPSESETPKAPAKPPSLPLGALHPSPSLNDTSNLSLFSLGKPGEDLVDRPRLAKRHFTEADLPERGGPGIDKDSPDIQHPLKRTRTDFGSVPSPLATPSRSFLGALTSKGKNRDVGLPDTRPTNPLPLSLEPEDDDYDSWEAGLSHQAILAIHKEMREGEGVGVAGPSKSHEIIGGNEGSEGDDTENDAFLSPNFGEFPLRSRRRERSQTAPELASIDLSATAYPIPQAEPLRRAHSSYAQLDALQEAYAMVVECDGVSQMPVEELLQLKRLTSRIGQTVDEQIYHQLVMDKRGSSMSD